MTAAEDSYADEARLGSAPEPGALVEFPSVRAAPPDPEFPAWHDVGRPAAERVADLLARMTLEEKLGQLCSVWLNSEPDGGEVAPHQHDLADIPLNWPDMLRQGLGQLTRPFGTSPLSPVAAARALAQVQRQVVAASRFGIPAIAHDECLSGFAAWQAAIYPIPLAWGASFDPALVERMAGQIGASMRSVGIHQGLAPVLDVTVDPRWGRTEETIGEDPYLVATVGTAYVRGLESAGLVSTLKHFVGYSTSRGGRNLAPATVTPRQIIDRLLPPFEMAIRHGARSVMHAYTDIDGLPTAADASLLSGVLRDAWGFSGTVVADYFGISFLELLHGVAADAAGAGALALAAGVDVELPTTRCFGAPLAGAVRRGEVDEALVDRAARRVLLQKCELGLLDPGWDPCPPALTEAGESTTADGDNRAEIDLDRPAYRATARALAEESIVLLANDGILPLAPSGGRIAVIGPRADDPYAMLGCYSFPSHVGVKHPGLELGVEIRTFLSALREELPGRVIGYAQGCGVDDPDPAGLAAAAALAADADVCIAVVGDRSGLFGRGTSGEGCDAADLNLPGLQAQLITSVLATGTPVILVLLAGRPYAIGAFAAAATVQAFFPGEEGGPALARVLSGAVNPSGHLPVSVPRQIGGEPASYLASNLARRSAVSSIDPSPLYPFGHGLSYTTFTWGQVRCQGARWPQDTDVRPAPPVAQIATDGTVEVSLTVRNTGDRAGTELVQLYLHDPVAQVTRPATQLIGYARVELEPGQESRVTFTMHADMTSFAGRANRRIVEGGLIELRLGRSSAATELVVPVELVGPERMVDISRELVTVVEISQPGPHASGRKTASIALTCDRTGSGFRPAAAASGARQGTVSGAYEEEHWEPSRNR
jgi:beta-xylosidase